MLYASKTEQNKNKTQTHTLGRARFRIVSLNNQIAPRGAWALHRETLI